MLDEGIRPDAVAFIIILTACSRACLVDDGCRYFVLMIREYSFNPSPDHFAIMVDILGKSGKLKAAYKLIRSMLVESHVGARGALLGACRLHRGVDLEADRWLDIFHFRDKGVRKLPGYTQYRPAFGDGILVICWTCNCQKNFPFEH